MFNLTIDEAKALLKKVQEDKKKVLNGAKKSVFVGNSIESANDKYNYVKAQYKNFFERYEAEKERAALARLETSKLPEWGFEMVNGYVRELPKSKYSGKANDKELTIWTETTFVKIQEELWEIEFDENLLIEHMKYLAQNK